MKLKTLIIDDEPIALEKLKSYVESIPFLELVAACQGSSEALEYLSDNSVDVIFTDIDMPDINGVAFVESLTPRPLVVFTTAYREFAVDGFRLSAVDYLVKPYRLVDFQRAANKVLEVYKSRHPETAERKQHGADGFIFIKVETRYERVPLRDIVYIKGFGEYLQVYISNSDRPLLTISSFGLIMKSLTHPFLQIHRSYAVNMDRVIRIEKSRVTTDTGVTIPLGNNYRAEFFEYLRNNSVGGTSFRD